MKEIGSYWKEATYNKVYKIIKYSKSQEDQDVVQIEFVYNECWYYPYQLVNDIPSTEDEYLLSRIK